MADGKDKDQKTVDDPGPAGSGGDDGVKDVSLEKMIEIAKAAGIEAKDVNAFMDQHTGKAIKIHDDKRTEKQKEVDAEAAKAAEEVRRQEEIDKLKGDAKLNAEAKETLRKAEEKELELIQRECRAVCVGAGIKDLPTGIKFDSEEDAAKFVTWYESAKPASSGGGGPPGKPDASPTPQPAKTAKEKVEEHSKTILATLFPDRYKEE